jgi:hypothetical protein
VWSVWSKTVELYLGATYSMLRCAHQPVVVVTHPATLPVDRVLLRIKEAAQAAASPRSQNLLHGANLRVLVGGSLCPPINLLVPTGIKNWQELQVLAQANVARQLGINAQQTACEWDAHATSINAAVPFAWVQGLQDWAQRERAKVVSIQPLWAVATQSRLARQGTMRALWLQEKDGISLVACPSSVTARAPSAGVHHPTPHSVFLATPTDATTTDTATRWLAEQGIAPPETLKMTFDDVARTAINGTPNLWREHWGVV